MADDTPPLHSTSAADAAAHEANGGRDPNHAPGSEFLAATGDNAEQADEPGQAHSVAEDALHRATAVFGADESEKVASGDEFDDVPDTVDRMEQMVSSGHIDMDAFRGERSDDDEPGMLGEDGLEPGEPA